MTLGKIESRRDLSTNVKTSFEPNFRRLEMSAAIEGGERMEYKYPRLVVSMVIVTSGFAVYHTLATERITLNFGVIMH